MHVLYMNNDTEYQADNQLKKIRHYQAHKQIKMDTTNKDLTQTKKKKQILMDERSCWRETKLTRKGK